MDSPRVGVVRDSMLTNPLHIKASLGKVRSRGLATLGPDFTYGLMSTTRDGGVAEVLSDWKEQPDRIDSAHFGKGHAPLPDFVSLNRDAVRCGHVTSKQLSEYRAQQAGHMTKKKSTSSKLTNRGSNKRREGGGASSSSSRQPAIPDITFGVTTRGKQRREGGGASSSSSRQPAIPDITFGVTTRASSPLCDLLSHQYAHRWLKEQLERDRTANMGQANRITPGCIPETRTTLLRRSKPLCIDPTVKNTLTEVPAALDTFRDPAERIRAVRANQKRGHAHSL